MINKIIRNFIAKRMAGRSDDGIMITLKDPQKVTLAENILMDTLMRSGIDPRSIQNEAQLKNILNQIKAANEQAMRNQTVSGIRGARQAEVFDLEGKKIPPGSRIMGGQEMPPPGSRGGPEDIAAPVQSAEESTTNLTDSTIQKMLKMEPINAMKEANKVIKREGVYKALDEKQAKKILNDTEDHIFQRDPKPSEFDPDPDEFATGGRVGLFMGSRPATQKGLAALREMLRFFSKGKNRTGSEILKMVNPKTLNKLLNDPAIYNKFSVKEGLAAPDMIKNMQNQMTGERKKVVSEILGAAKNIQKADENTIKYKNEMIEEMVKKGADEETAKGLAQLMTSMAEDAAGKMPDAPKLTKEGVEQLELILKDMETGGKKARDLNADGGRIGYKDGPKMTRRTFLKYLTGLAAIPIVGKVFKPLKTVKGVKNVPIVKTGDAVGKPEWFDQLVNKVIIEGDDVTKKFATKDREVVHTKKIDENSEVTVTQDLEDGTVRVEYDSPENMGQDRVMLQYKPGMADEATGKKPRDEFEAVEAEPRFVGGPEDADIEFDAESGGPGLMFLESDVSKLKQYATGKGPTMKEFVKSKKRKDYVEKINEDSYEAAQHISGKYGDGPEPDFPDDYDGFASGGIAGMLGE